MTLMDVMVTLMFSVPIILGILAYTGPYVRRRDRRPKSIVASEPIALDPNMFKAKRKAIDNEHRVWGEEFKRCAGHSWKYKPITVEPEIWDEEADELLTAEEREYLKQTFLTERCNHTIAEDCVHCDGGTYNKPYTPMRRKRQK